MSCFIRHKWTYSTEDEYYYSIDDVFYFSESTMELFTKTLKVNHQFTIYKRPERTLEIRICSKCFRKQFKNEEHKIWLESKLNKDEVRNIKINQILK